MDDVDLAISIHAAREGGDLKDDAVIVCNEISIHAAREGGDMEEMQNSYAGLISIHAAREGGDRDVFQRRLNPWRFQSTPPVKAATLPVSSS